jgi:hypothetical protein
VQELCDAHNMVQEDGSTAGGVQPPPAPDSVASNPDNRSVEAAVDAAWAPAVPALMLLFGSAVVGIFWQ